MSNLDYLRQVPLVEATYLEKYGVPIPPGLRKYVADTAQTRGFLRAMQDALAAGRPLADSDWDRYVTRLRRRSPPPGEGPASS